MKPAVADSHVQVEVRRALGFQRGPLLYAASDTLASVCGNTICFQEEANGAQVCDDTYHTSEWVIQRPQTCLLCSDCSMELLGALSASKST